MQLLFNLPLFMLPYVIIYITYWYFFLQCLHHQLDDQVQCGKGG